MEKIELGSLVKSETTGVVGEVIDVNDTWVKIRTPINLISTLFVNTITLITDIKIGDRVRHITDTIGSVKKILDEDRVIIRVSNGGLATTCIKNLTKMEEETMEKNKNAEVEERKIGMIEKITTKRMLRRMGIKRVENNIEKKTTTVFLKNGIITVAHCSSEDHYDPAVGLAMAYTVAMATNGNKKLFKKKVEWIMENGGNYTATVED